MEFTGEGPGRGVRRDGRLDCDVVVSSATPEMTEIATSGSRPWLKLSAVVRLLRECRPCSESHMGLVFPLASSLASRHVCVCVCAMASSLPRRHHGNILCDPVAPSDTVVEHCSILSPFRQLVENADECFFLDNDNEELCGVTLCLLSLRSFIASWGISPCPSSASRACIVALHPDHAPRLPKVCMFGPLLGRRAWLLHPGVRDIYRKECDSVRRKVRTTTARIGAGDPKIASLRPKGRTGRRVPKTSKLGVRVGLWSPRVACRRLPRRRG